MATSDEFVVLAQKRFLSRDRHDENFFQYLYEDCKDLWTSIFPEPGVFTYPVTITPNAGSFDLSSLPLGAYLEGLDNGGHKLILDGVARCTGIPYEDDGASFYWIALHYAEIPSGVYANPRTGKAEFDKTKEEIGLRDYPDLVTDTGFGTIEFRIDSICPSAAPSDYSGRSAWVWLRNPQSSDVSIALEQCVIAWDGVHNTITTAAAFGQSTISTTVNDYYVCLDGSCVYNIGGVVGVNPYSDDYLLLGYINSTVPVAVDQALQIDLSGGGGHTLQKAYDGLGGSGSGRTVTVANQAVFLSQANTTVYEADIFQSVLRNFKDDDIVLPGNPLVGPYASTDVENSIDTKMRLRSFTSYIDRRNLMDTTGGDALRGSETVDLLVGTNTISFTRGAPLDLTAPGSNAIILPNNILEFYDFVEINGSANNQDGVYIINSVASASTLDVYTMDFDTPVFVAEVGLTARLYRPLVSIGKNYGHIHIVSVEDYISDIGAMASSIPFIVDVTSTFGAASSLALFRRDPHTGTDYFKIRGNGGIESTATVEADDSITSHNNVLTDNDHGYTVGHTKTITVRYGPDDFQLTAGAPAVAHTTPGDPTTAIVLSMAVGDLVVCELKLPQGAIFNKVSMLWNPNKAGSTVRFWQEAHTYGGAPVVVNPVNFGAGAMDLISVGGGLQDLNATYGGITTIDNDSYRYYITVQPDGASAGDLIYELKLTFDVDYLRAMGA